MDERLALRLGWLEEITSAKEWTRATDVQSINMIGYLLKGDLDTGEAHPMGQRPYRLPLTKRAVLGFSYAVTVEDSHPLPHIQDIFDALLVKKKNFYGRRSRKMLLGF